MTKTNNIERRLFDLGLWLVSLSVLLALLTSCSPARPIATAPATEPPAIGDIVDTGTTPAATRQSGPTWVPEISQCTVRTGIPAGYLNLRTGAGIDRSVIRVLDEGETLTVLARGPWLTVRDRQGNRGYVNARYCELQSAAAGRDRR